MSKNIELTKLAHDLKGPLHSIKGLLQVASRDVDHEQAQRFFTLIEHFQELLYYRINDLLNNVNLSEKKQTHNFLEQSQIFDSIRPPLRDLIDSGKTDVLKNPQKLSLSDKIKHVDELNDTLDLLEKKWTDKKANKPGASNLVVLVDDIKKSVHSIKVLLEIAVDEIENKTAMEYFELIDKSCEQLFTRAEETLTNLNRDGINNSTCIDFTEMMHKVQSSLQNMDGFSDIKFEIEIKNNIPFFSDSDSIRSIIQNLMENAVKYRKKDNSSHEVSFSVQDSTKGIDMKISDNGIGIKKELFSKIFNFGVRANNLSVEGHGIGLSLVKKLLGKLGGKISLNSIDNQGSIFSLSIPNNPIHLSREITQELHY